MNLIALLILSQTPIIDLREDGVKLGRARAINCSGAGVTCSIDAASKIATLEVSGGGGGGLPDGGDISGEPFVTYSSTSVLASERVLSAGNYTTIDVGTAAQAQVDWAHGLTCSAGQVLTSASTSTMQCTSTITASDLVCAGTCVSDAEIAAMDAAKLTGTVVAARGGLGATQPTCGAGDFLTCNGTTCSCATPAGGSGISYAEAAWGILSGY